MGRSSVPELERSQDHNATSFPGQSVSGVDSGCLQRPAMEDGKQQKLLLALTPSQIITLTAKPPGTESWRLSGGPLCTPCLSQNETNLLLLQPAPAKKAEEGEKGEGIVSVIEKIHEQSHSLAGKSLARHHTTH